MEQTREQKESEVIANCDAIVFASYQKPEEEEIHTIMTFFKTENDVQPTELGHKFNILMFKKHNPAEEEIDMFTAIIGDPEGYVKRIGRVGYHGILVKRGAIPNKAELVEVFRKVLKTWGFKDKLINKTLAETVV